MSPHTGTNIGTIRPAKGYAPAQRRLILIASSIALLTVLTAASWGPGGAAFRPVLRANLTHGPVVSAVDHDSAIVFARVSKGAGVRILYSSDPGFLSDRHWTAKQRAAEENDFTVHLRLEDLQPATTYYYAIFVGRRHQELVSVPQFTTAPPPESSAAFRFAVLSDLSVLPQDAPAYAAVAGEDPAFVLQIGDFDHRDPGADWRPDISIENWRQMHRDVLGDNPAGRQFAASIGPRYPFYHIWDDHDYGANNSDLTAWWKPMATQAFREYYALPTLPNAQAGLWYSFRYAQAEVFLLDLRSQRSPNDDPPGPAKSMLDGAGVQNGQKAWLKDSLASSTASWKFIVSSSVWNPNSKQTDSWYQYQDEQNELVAFVRDNDIRGVVIVSGDLHSGGAIDDGTNSYLPELSVPPTNFPIQSDCTGGYCGQWSEGVISGSDPSGYALISLEHDPDTGADRAILQARAVDGSLRLEYSVELP